MLSEDRLREKLRKIEALYAGATTAGEKSAAGAAAERIRRQFEAASKTEQTEEFKFSITDTWSRQLFIALCRRYGIRPYRYARMHRQTVMVRAPASFVQLTLWIIADEKDERLPVDARASLIVLAAQFQALHTMIGINRETDHRATSCERGEQTSCDRPRDRHSGRERHHRHYHRPECLPVGA
jgi:hypothetical protein